MKAIVALALAVPLAVGIGAWVLRASRIPPPAPVVKARPTATPEMEPSPAPDLSAEPGPAEIAERRKIDQDKAHEELRADDSRRIDELIESIDWTGAESRVRFPAEYESAREALPDE